MFFPSPPPEASTWLTLLPPPPASVVDGIAFHSRSRLTTAGGFMFVAVVCALMILLMFILHYYQDRQYRARVVDIEARFLASQAAQVLAQFRSERARQRGAQVYAVEHRPAEEASAATLIAYKQINKEEIDSSGDCAICMDGFEEEGMCRVIDNCSHFFHKDCIDQWLTIESRCPLCRCFVHVIPESRHENQA